MRVRDVLHHFLTRGERRQSFSRSGNAGGGLYRLRADPAFNIPFLEREGGTLAAALTSRGEKNR